MDIGKRDILKIIESLGGKADFDIIKNKYEELPNNQSSYLWAHLRDLCKFGDIVEASPKIYSLTEEGKQRVLDKNYSNWRHYDKADWV